MHEVVRNCDQRRYELHVDGTLAGFAEYVERGGRLLLVHTEIAPAFGGRGLGTELIRGTLDQVRASGEPIVPLCPFVVAFLEGHPEYDDLVDHEMVARLNAPRGA